MRAWTSAQSLAAHSQDFRQFCDMRLSTLANGQRIIHAHNAAGLNLSFLPDRGLDIWQAHYQGIPLTWTSGGSPHKADYGQSWLGQFNGGLLTTCGLAHVGAAEADDLNGERRDIHGNFTRLSAQDVNITLYDGINRLGELDWVGIELRGTLYEGRLFGAQWKIERHYLLSFDQPKLILWDTVINGADQPMPLMLLYHVNLGYPLVREGAQLYTPHERVIPRDPAAEVGFASWGTYDAPLAQYPEQVFYHVLRAQDSTTEVVMHQDDFGLSLKWDCAAAPYFTQWKNTRQGMYVCGIEPGNCIPEGQNAARQAQRLEMVEAGGRRRFDLSLEVLGSLEAVRAATDRVTHLAETGQRALNNRLSP
jgi:hypothetical protein